MGLAAKAKSLQAAGRSIINFSVGEPDFNTPSEVISAAMKAAERGETKYTAVSGTMAARQAVANRLSEDYQCPFEASEVMLSTGGKQAIFHVMQAILEPGDEVLLPSPYWTSFPEMLKMLGAKPVILPHREGRLEASDLAAAISSRTRMFIFNNPANPHGVVYHPKEIESFLDVIEEHPIWLLSDDTYYQLTYEQDFVSAISLRPSFKPRTAVIGSLSKSYAMTGWRLGWAILPPEIHRAAVKIQGQVTSGPNSISQAAAIEALGPSNHWAKDFRESFRARLQFLKQELKRELPELEYMPPQGAFYCFLKLGGVLKKESVAEFCARALEEWGVCLVPGEAFGAEAFARLSYALSEEEIAEGIKRLRQALS